MLYHSTTSTAVDEHGGTLTLAIKYFKSNLFSVCVCMGHRHAMVWVCVYFWDLVLSSHDVGSRDVNQILRCLSHWAISPSP